MEKNRVDGITGLLLLGLLAFAYYSSRSFPENSQFFVNVVLAFLLVCTLVYVAQTAYRIWQAKKEETKDEEKVALINGKILGGMIFFALYIFLAIPVIGFYPATALMTFGLSWFLGSRQKKALALLSVAFPFVLFLIFQVALEIYLPRGMFF